MITEVNNMRGKRAQSLSLNAIIIAALALIVLVVIAMIFTGKINKWSGSVEECTNKGGICADECGVDTAQNYVTQNGKCSDEKVCCLPVNV
jgi:hypothetical protein